MNFERGKDPMEAMGIGRKANAIEIHGVSEIKFEREEAPDGMHTNYRKYYSEPFSPSDAIRILMGIEAMELDADNFGIQFLEGDGHMDFPIHGDMHHSRGEFVKFRDHYYFIPKEFEQKKFEMPNLSNLSCH
jgi:hypothetical protein